MTIHTLPIPLSDSSSGERLIKRSARGLFRFVRGSFNQAQRVPGLLHIAATDIRDAWAETGEHNSLPNA